MKINLKINKFVVTGILMGLAILSGGRTWANNPQVIPPHAYSFGKSYGEWSAEWWKWQLSLPATDHPGFSLDGANCDVGQSGKVWFLTGAFTTEVPANEFNTIVRESCVVPTGKAIFFPIINIECSSIEDAPFLLIEDDPGSNVDTCAANFVDGTFAIIDDLSVTVDGKLLESLEAFRFQSPVFDFSFDVPSDNILGVDCSIVDCTNPRSVSDGFWIMLTPLSRGYHTINFTGSFRDPGDNNLFFGLDVTYELLVD